MPTAVCYPPPPRYTDRLSKARYIADKYSPILGGRVLDVGCDVRQLATHLPAGAAYTGVDQNPAADAVLDLDSGVLPFGDRAFDTVVCADVLEHLERLHAVFDELCRVSADRVIVSLPNPYRAFVLAAVEERLDPLKHYGLPLEPPRDRHRWFFGAAQAEAFIRHRAGRNGFEVEQLDVEDHGCPAWPDARGVDRFAGWNVRGGTTWAVLRRGPGATRRPA
jgi:2-polyprenyl-3-methyl-5-hydroxy-6-metoxy-1,4-benzoquinol methylase